MLSESQLARYHEDGFVVPDLRVPDEVLDDIKARHTRFVAAKPEYSDYCPALLDIEPGFRAYCNRPEILDMVEQVLGPDFALWNASFFAKPAHIGTTTPWHQDGEYWPIRPLATCTVWLAVDDSTRENGCLRVIRGSHQDRRLRPHLTNDGPGLALNREFEASEYDESEAVDIVLEHGRMSLHDVYLLHGSEANRSAQSRRGMTMRFMPTTSVFDRQVAAEQARSLSFDHSMRQIYLMRGRDLSGKNDFTEI